MSAVEPVIVPNGKWSREALVTLGREYLTLSGTPTRHPVLMSFADAEAAIAAHDERVSA